MSKKAAKPEATGATAESTSGTDNPAVTSKPTTANPADAAAGGGSVSPDSAASDGSTIEAAKPDTPSPQQQLSGAAEDGGAGATDKPTAASKVPAKALYVVGTCPVLHDHEVYQTGDELELTAAEAARLDGKVATATANA